MNLITSGKQPHLGAFNQQVLSQQLQHFKVAQAQPLYRVNNDQIISTTWKDGS